MADSYMAKFICSYGGEIQLRTRDNHHLSYLGGHTKILSIDRSSIKLPAMVAKLSALFDAPGDVSFKYQLPGDYLNTLVSVADDEDLNNMMLEYDHLHRASATPARMRLFLFPNNPPSHQIVGSDLNVKHPLEARWHFQLSTSSSSSSSSFASCSSHLIGPLTYGKYDVFISFRGEDTRTNFICHLYEALTQKQVKTFIDYELHKGDDISLSLLRTIEISYVSVVVFSESYASSKWCLEELVKILECRKKHGQVVIPVFYDVDPSHIRKQIGSYREAFEKHLQNFMLDKSKVQQWKDALTEAANLAGWDSHSRSYRDDVELIQKIVKDVLQKLNYHYPHNDFKSLVGIYENIARLELLLQEAQSVGICGMGGIGEGSCFLENVRERSGEHGQGLHDLRIQLYMELLQEKNCQSGASKFTFVECRLRMQQNFIVLDDVNSSKQLEFLLRELQSYGSSSKIIITTRDKSVLENRRVEKMHKVEGLHFQESLTLFSWNAFNEDCPEVGYQELSQRAVVYCNGVPLALVVLGSFLHSKSEIEWDNALKKLEKIPNEEIQNVLRLSYDGLNFEEKQIFLEIACFFKGEPKTRVIELLESYGLYPIIGMRSLHDKALIDISSNSMCMHDLIQQMGHEIVRQESIENPGNRSRLFNFDDCYDVLKNNKGTDAIKGIMLDLSHSRQNLYLSADNIKKTSGLRFLKFFISSSTHGKLCDLHLPTDLESFSNELRYFEWHAHPLQSLPSNFCTEKLVILRMENSLLKRLWDGEQNLVNLKELNLARCKELMELPDFSKAQNLERVCLSQCISLCHVHPSILSLDTLEDLDLYMCAKLQMLESETHLRSLRRLILFGCSSLTKFSLSSKEMELLDLSGTRVKVLHSSIGRLNKIKVITLSGLRLENLPKELSCLKSLETLLLSRCEVVSKHNLHVILDGLQALQILYLGHCHHLFELPDNVGSLPSLQELVLDGSHVERLPQSIKHLSSLKRLSLMGCKRLQSLPQLPSSLCHLNAINCTFLQTVPFCLTTPLPKEAKRISFENCVNLDVIRALVYGLALREKGGRVKVTGETRRICYPDCRVPEWFTYRTKGNSITLGLAQTFNHYFGFLICVVLSPFSSSNFDYIEIGCRCNIEDGNMHKYSTASVLLSTLSPKWDLDHVVMSYASCHSSSIFKKIPQFNYMRPSESYSPKKVTFEFCVYWPIRGFVPNNNWLIKECGVYPLKNGLELLYQTGGIGVGYENQEASG